MTSQPPNNSNPYAWQENTQAATPNPPPSSQQGDHTGGVIPYKNPKALIAYYLGICSGFPLIGLPIGIAAFILGIKGLQARKANPVIKGSVHAWIGIGCGGLFTIVWGLVLVLILVAIVGRWDV
jgi:hypothetical protein